MRCAKVCPLILFALYKVAGSSTCMEKSLFVPCRGLTPLTLFYRFLLLRMAPANTEIDPTNILNIQIYLAIKPAPAWIETNEINAIKYDIIDRMTKDLVFLSKTFLLFIAATLIRIICAKIIISSASNRTDSTRWCRYT